MNQRDLITEELLSFLSGTFPLGLEQLEPDQRLKSRTTCCGSNPADHLFVMRSLAGLSTAKIERLKNPGQQEPKDHIEAKVCP